MLNKYLLGDFFSRSLALPDCTLAFIPGSENLTECPFLWPHPAACRISEATWKHMCGCDGDDVADKATDVFSF